MPSTKYVTIIGIGMDGWKTVTVEAVRAIESADVLIGAARMLEPFSYNVKPTLVSYQSNEIAAFIQTKDYTRFAVLVSGDSGFYSLAASLTPLLASIKDVQVDVISGISTPVYFCSRLHMPWSDLHFVSLHGAQSSIVRQVCAHRLTFFLLGGSVTPAAICRRLTEYGRGHITVHIGENLALPDERIRSGKAAELTEIETDRLCALIAENPDWEAFLPCGIDDGQFVRGKVPMTKAEVRSVCVAKLSIGSGDRCWDIGCGTGSVSVEMALRCPDGQVTAMDKKQDAIDLTTANARQFGCDNIETILADAAVQCGDLPSPDCVFVGGSGGHMEEVLTAAAAKNPQVRVVATAVSLETLQEWNNATQRLGWDADITQIAVTRTRKVGTHTMLSAENPIFIMQRKMSKQ